MASGDIFERYQPQALTSESGRLGQLVPAGAVSGVRLGKGGPTADGSAYLALGKVWANGTPLSTGLTVEVVIVDDANNPDPGAAVVLGATIVPLTSGGVITPPAQTNEATATVTLSSTEGNVTVATITVANSKLSSLAAGNNFLLRLRRVSTAVADTHTGAVILLGATVKDS
jgi:hypothetical protein